MRTTASVLALMLAMTGLVAAQEYSDYISIKDGFKITFPLRCVGNNPGRVVLSAILASPHQ